MSDGSAADHRGGSAYYDLSRDDFLPTCLVFMSCIRHSYIEEGFAPQSSNLHLLTAFPRS